MNQFMSNLAFGTYRYKPAAMSQMRQHAILSESTLLPLTKQMSRQRIRPNIRPLVPQDSCDFDYILLQ